MSTSIIVSMLMDVQRTYITNSSIFVIDLFLNLKNFFSSSCFISILAGSYAQLTLLGQPKVQKSIPNDLQNGRIQYRTQSSNPERSNSILSTNSSQAIIDIKKARDQYEKILKQLEVNSSERNFSYK